MSSKDPIFNQPSFRDRLTEADAIRQGYSSAFDFLAVWNVIADYSRKERLLREPVRLNQLPAEIFWFGTKSATLGTVAAIGIGGIRLLLFGLSWYVFDLDRDMVNVVYLILVTILAMQFYTVLSNYLHHPGGITDQLISININCVTGSVITIEVIKIICIIYLFVFYPHIASVVPDKAYMTLLLKWLYIYFFNDPWKLVLESWFVMQIIICGNGLVNKQRLRLVQNAEFDLATE